MEFIDIGANLTDGMFYGSYHGKEKHEPDLGRVIDRAREHGVKQMMLTVGSVSDMKDAYDLCKHHPGELFATVGIHPTRAKELESGKITIDRLRQVANDNKGTIAAYGEFGLDYDRLHFCPAGVQRKWFEKQLELAVELELPLFLHCRAAADDFLAIITPFITRLKGGVVHSYTGDVAAMRKMIEMGLHIGVNGCSLKTEENLDVVKQIPLDRLMLETDCPYCDIRATHAGSGLVKTKFNTRPNHRYDPSCLVKGRCEPCQIVQVAEVVSVVCDVPVEQLAKTAFDNTCAVFTMLRQ
ncbi:TatD family [Carpediemonas membranifera]|uniref:TatD family n=1 Tax=Carpediemonas membranifera TaxID=201153 RepID=A0A8J6BBN9_9EUKA|nr:TatD family [Carpediemonas membranifera]|eukprot:KAG9396917.1 TatD family [Carpediemonas membranifera]